MKNKLISIALSTALLTPTLSSATNLSDSFEATSTSGGTWKDARTGMTYYSGGSKTFTFKNASAKYPPWMKIRAPSIKAGCGGVSINGGFASFLNLKDIGKQLETAISSAGMGVLVVLVQTLPSIGKAFKDIQDLVRKIQSMLQNSCQIMTTALSSIPEVKEAQGTAQHLFDEYSGSNWVSDHTKGLSDKLDKFEENMKCKGDANEDTFKKCMDGIVSFIQTGTRKVSKTPSEVNKAPKGIKKILSNSLKDKFSKAKIYSSSLKEIIEDNKFDNIALSSSDEEIDNIKTKLLLENLLFGYFTVDTQTCFSSLAKADGTIDQTMLKKAITKGDDSILLPCTSKFNPTKTSASDIVKFLTSDLDTSGSNVASTEVPNYKVKLFKKWSKVGTSTDGLKASGESNKVVYIWSEPLYTPNSTTDDDSTDDDSTDTITVEWNNLYKDSYNLILKKVKSETIPDDTSNIPIYVPNGEYRLTQIKNFALTEDAKETYSKLLARLNVQYALENVIAEMEQKILLLTEDLTSDEAQKTIAFVDKRAKLLRKYLADQLGGLTKEVRIAQIFNELEQIGSREKRKAKIK